VAQLNSALNKWHDSVPDHCKVYVLHHEIQFLLSFIHSTMGPPTNRRNILRSIRLPILSILSTLDYGSPTVCAIRRQRECHGCSCSFDMYQRRSVLCSGHRCSCEAEEWPSTHPDCEDISPLCYSCTTTTTDHLGLGCSVPMWHGATTEYQGREASRRYIQCIEGDGGRAEVYGPAQGL
jgi:hypothetical protein